jgi:thermitase
MHDTCPISFYERAAFAAFEYVEPNYYVHSSFTPNDPLWSSQWGPRKVLADLAWDIELGQKSMIVAVIDTGIGYHHEDLAGNHLPSGYDWVNHDDDPMDDSINCHGTHVAGVNTTPYRQTRFVDGFKKQWSIWGRPEEIASSAVGG